MTDLEPEDLGLIAEGPTEPTQKKDKSRYWSIYRLGWKLGIWHRLEREFQLELARLRNLRERKP